MSIPKPVKWIIVSIILFIVLVLLLFAGIIVFFRMGTECFYADSIVFLDTINIENRKSILILRTTGLADKALFLEVYEDSVSFDGCGKTDSKIKAGIYASCDDSTMGPMAVRYWKDSLELCCTPDTAKRQWFDSLKFSQNGCMP